MRSLSYTEMDSNEMDNAFKAGNYDPTIEFLNKVFTENNSQEIKMVGTADIATQLLSKAPVEDIITKIYPHLESKVFKIAALEAASSKLMLQVAKTFVQDILSLMFEEGSDDEDSEE